MWYFSGLWKLRLHKYTVKNKCCGSWQFFTDHSECYTKSRKCLSSEVY